MDYRILLRFFLRKFAWSQGYRGGVIFGVKASQKPFGKRGGGVFRGPEGLKMGLEVL